MKIEAVRAHVLRAPLEQPVAHHSLFPAEPLLEFDTSSHPFREHLTDYSLRQRGGWVEIPLRPGLGIEVDRKTLERYAS